MFIVNIEINRIKLVIEFELVVFVFVFVSDITIYYREFT